MGSEPGDFRLETYRSLREETAHYAQAMGAVVAVALTAVGAIGAFALSKPGDVVIVLALAAAVFFGTQLLGAFDAYSRDNPRRFSKG